MFEGHTDIVNALLSQESIDINKARTDNGETPLDKPNACYGGKCIQI